MALASLNKHKHEAVSTEHAASSSDSGAEDTDNESQTEGNAGWADCMAKVLKTTKPKTKKTLVLSRAKKIQPGGEKEKSKQKDYGFEVEGELKEEEKPDKEELTEKLKQRKNQSLALRVKPSWRDMERERTLRKVATRGVVQLFNAVRIQQKDLQQQLEEAGPLDSRKDAVLNNINKRKFLDVLMSGSRAKSEAVDNAVKDEFKKEEDTDDDEEEEDVVDAAGSSKKRKSEWSVLSKDFMTNKKIKHWDEEDEDDAEAANDSAQNDEDDDE